MFIHTPTGLRASYHDGAIRLDPNGIELYRYIYLPATVDGQSPCEVTLGGWLLYSNIRHGEGRLMCTETTIPIDPVLTQTLQEQGVLRREDAIHPLSFITLVGLDEVNRVADSLQVCRMADTTEFDGVIAKVVDGGIQLHTFDSGVWFIPGATDEVTALHQLWFDTPSVQWVSGPNDVLALLTQSRRHTSDIIKVHRYPELPDCNVYLTRDCNLVVVMYHDGRIHGDCILPHPVYGYDILSIATAILEGPPEAPIDENVII